MLWSLPAFQSGWKWLSPVGPPDQWLLPYISTIGPLSHSWTLVQGWMSGLDSLQLNSGEYDKTLWNCHLIPRPQCSSISLRSQEAGTSRSGWAPQTCRPHHNQETPWISWKSTSRFLGRCHRGSSSKLFLAQNNIRLGVLGLKLVVTLLHWLIQ